jgi:hypothetical protein
MGKHLSDNFPVQWSETRDALATLFFNFSLEYVFKKVLEN